MIGICQIGKCQYWLLSDHLQVFKNWLMSRLVNVIAKIVGTCLIGYCLCFDWQMSNWRIAIGKGLISGRQIGKWHSIMQSAKSRSYASDVSSVIPLPLMTLPSALLPLAT